MQCITYDIEKVDSASFFAVRIGKGATLSAILAQCVCFGAEATEIPKLTATLAERVTITAERICSFVPGDAYLTVQPFGLNGGGVFRIKGGGRYCVLKEDVVNGNYNSKYTGAEIEALLDIVANGANG